MTDPFLCHAALARHGLRARRLTRLAPHVTRVDARLTRLRLRHDRRSQEEHHRDHRRKPPGSAGHSRDRTQHDRHDEHRQQQNRLSHVTPHPQTCQ